MDKATEHIILETHDLCIGYRLKKSLKFVSQDINVNLKKGKMVCLLGKNGIGKSTLLRTLMRVQDSLGGKIMLHQQDIKNIGIENLAKKISLVSTERIPSSHLNAYELIALGRQPYTNWIGTLLQEDHDQIDLAIERTHINELLAKKIDELSDGQVQKVMIARALAQNTDLIGLDEPTAQLDIHNKIEIFKLLKHLCRTLNKTVLISTHEIHLALQLADELWLMDENGLTSGDPQTLIKNGELQKLFSSNLVTFDSNSQQFIIKED